MVRFALFCSRSTPTFLVLLVLVILDDLCEERALFRGQWLWRRWSHLELIRGALNQQTSAREKIWVIYCFCRSSCLSVESRVCARDGPVRYNVLIEILSSMALVFAAIHLLRAKQSAFKNGDLLQTENNGQLCHVGLFQHRSSGVQAPHKKSSEGTLSEGEFTRSSANKRNVKCTLL